MTWIYIVKTRKDYKTARVSNKNSDVVPVRWFLWEVVKTWRHKRMIHRRRRYTIWVNSHQYQYLYLFLVISNTSTHIEINWYRKHRTYIRWASWYLSWSWVITWCHLMRYWIRRARILLMIRVRRLPLAENILKISGDNSRPKTTMCQLSRGCWII